MLGYGCYLLGHGMPDHGVFLIVLGIGGLIAVLSGTVRVLWARREMGFVPALRSVIVPPPPPPPPVPREPEAKGKRKRSSKKGKQADR